MNMRVPTWRDRGSNGGSSMPGGRYIYYGLYRYMHIYARYRKDET
jgi:hypothetical protein